MSSNSENEKKSSNSLDFSVKEFSQTFNAKVPESKTLEKVLRKRPTSAGNFNFNLIIDRKINREKEKRGK